VHIRAILLNVSDSIFVGVSGHQYMSNLPKLFSCIGQTNSVTTSGWGHELDILISFKRLKYFIKSTTRLKNSLIPEDFPISEKHQRLFRQTKPVKTQWEFE